VEIDFVTHRTVRDSIIENNKGNRMLFSGALFHLQSQWRADLQKVRVTSSNRVTKSFDAGIPHSGDATQRKRNCEDNRFLKLAPLLAKPIHFARIRFLRLTLLPHGDFFSTILNHDLFSRKNRGVFAVNLGSLRIYTIPDR